MHQHVIVGQEVERQIEVDPDLQRGQRRMIREIDDRPAWTVPATAKQAGTFAREIGKRAAAQPPQIHQTANPWAMRPSSASTWRLPKSVSSRLSGVSPSSSGVARA